MKTMREIASYIAKREGLKSEVSIGNVREIVGIVSELIHDFETCGVLVRNGRRRIEAKKSKKRGKR